jgi:PKHD-type hydroxylase
MNQTMVYISKLFSDDFINYIESVVEPLPKRPGCDSFDNYANGQKVTDPSKHNHTKFIDPGTSAYKQISTVALDYVNLHSTSFNVDYYQTLAPIQYGVYEAGSAYKMHNDSLSDPKILFNRKLTIVCLLSDPTEFTGGHLNFAAKQDVIKTKGSAVLFPSYLYHSVTPITSGIRKTLVCMILGPQWR